MCNCKNITPQSKECYEQMIVVDIPQHMHQYAEMREKEGLSKQICIDQCIYDEIHFLWSYGVITYGSCCGHNNSYAFVNVDDKSIDKMLMLGYKQRHTDKKRKDTFELKINPPFFTCN